MASTETIEESAPAGEQPAAGGKRKNIMMAGIVLGIMLAEGAGIFILAKSMFGPPAKAEAADVAGLDAKAGVKAPPETELEVVRLRAQNERSQQLRVYDITVAAVFEEKETKPEPKGEAKAEGEEKKEGEGAAAKPTSKVAELLQRKKATLQDRFGRIVRSMDPQRFAEPDLSTIREQFKRELQQIVGAEAEVKEVLIPSITRSNED